MKKIADDMYEEEFMGYHILSDSKEGVKKFIDKICEETAEEIVHDEFVDEDDWDDEDECEDCEYVYELEDAIVERGRCLTKSMLRRLTNVFTVDQAMTLLSVLDVYVNNKAIIDRWVEWVEDEDDD